MLTAMFTMIKRIARAVLRRGRLSFSPPIHDIDARDKLEGLTAETGRQGKHLQMIADQLSNLESKIDEQLAVSKDAIASLRKLFPGQGELGWDDPRSSTSLFRELCVVSRAATIKVIETKMPDAMCILDHRDFLLDAIAHAPSTGLLLEFGVFSGTTLRWMAEAFPERQFYGFDSFLGLPAAWRGYKKMDFNRQGQAPELPSNVRLFIGNFDETVPSAFGSDDAIALVHIDCDLYESAKSVFGKLNAALRPGVILVFDEYFNYPGFQHHEFRALEEFLRDSKLHIEWLTYSGERAMGRLAIADELSRPA